MGSSGPKTKEQSLNDWSALSQKGTSQFFAHELMQKLSLQDRIAFAGELALRRYNKEKGTSNGFDPTQGFNQIYRNTEFFTKALLQGIVNEVDFPVSSNNAVGLFDLVQLSNDGNVDSKSELKDKIGIFPDEVLHAVLPFYHQFMEDIEEKSQELNESEREKYIQKAQSDFAGQIYFPFVENLSKALPNKTAKEKEALSVMLRELRKSDGLTNNWITQLDTANATYLPPVISEKVIDSVREIEPSIDGLLSEYKETVRNDTKHLVEQGNNIYNAGNTLANTLNDEDPQKNRILEVMNQANGAKSDLDQLLTINIVVDEAERKRQIKSAENTITNAQEKISTIIAQKDNDGMTPLGKAVNAVLAGDDKSQRLVERLAKAGADVNEKTKNYKRGFFTKIKDVFTQPGGLKNLITAPERSITEILEMSGQQDLSKTIKESAKQFDSNVKPKESSYHDVDPGLKNRLSNLGLGAKTPGLDTSNHHSKSISEKVVTSFKYFKKKSSSKQVPEINLLADIKIDIQALVDILNNPNHDPMQTAQKEVQTSIHNKIRDGNLSASDLDEIQQALTELPKSKNPDGKNFMSNIQEDVMPVKRGELEGSRSKVGKR